MHEYEADILHKYNTKNLPLQVLLRLAASHRRTGLHDVYTWSVFCMQTAQRIHLQS